MPFAHDFLLLDFAMRDGAFIFLSMAADKGGDLMSQGDIRYLLEIARYLFEIIYLETTSSILQKIVIDFEYRLIIERVQSV